MGVFVVDPENDPESVNDEDDNVEVANDPVQIDDTDTDEGGE